MKKVHAMLSKKIIIDEENKEAIELTSTDNYYTEGSLLQIDYITYLPAIYWIFYLRRQEM